jgi:VanZ family protein
MRFPPKPPWFAHQDKIVHMILFGVLALLLFLAFRCERRWTARLCFLVASLAASLYGATDELHQLLTPGRSPDLADWFADACGAVLFAGVAALFARGRPALPGARAA